LANDGLGVRIALEGEKEFKSALSDINQAFKVLGSEMKLATSQFDKNDSSVQSLTAKNTVLNKEIDQQKTKIETLRSALENASISFGETDKRTQSWQIQLNSGRRAGPRRNPANAQAFVPLCRS
jgi:phage-related minor tail protein